MINKQVIFSEPNKAELVEGEACYLSDRDGEHNFVRPKHESYPHHWTHQDGCNAILNMIASNRIQVEPIISRIEQPVNAPQIYNELCDNKNFPIGTVFDWRNI